jgi:S1-C subfamily serine protease
MEKAAGNERDPWGRGNRRRRRGPRLGITPTIAELTAEDKKKYGLGEKEGGILIHNRQQGSVAEKGGLKEGDIIIELAGKKIPEDNMWPALREILSNLGDTKEITYTVIRNGNRVSGKLKFP